MNIDYDGTVHAVDQDNGLPLCGSATMSACLPESTTEDVTCWECMSILD